MSLRILRDPDVRRMQVREEDRRRLLVVALIAVRGLPSHAGSPSNSQRS